MKHVEALFIQEKYSVGNSGNFPCQIERFFSSVSNLHSRWQMRNLRNGAMMVREDNKEEMEKACTNRTVISVLTCWRCNCTKV